MTTFLALLRGINVGGNKKVAMADLRDMLTALGFENVRTVLQSGNAVFRSGSRSSAQLEKLLESSVGKKLGLQCDFHVRTADEWKEVIARNPFPEAAKSDPSHLLVLFMKEAPAASDVKALQAAIIGPELVRAAGREVYIVYTQGIGTSKLSNVLIDKKLKMRGTARNWNTVLKLGALL